MMAIECLSFDEFKLYSRHRQVPKSHMVGSRSKQFIEIVELGVFGVIHALFPFTTSNYDCYKDRGRKDKSINPLK
jgi:hypothetical protein